MTGMKGMKVAVIGTGMIGSSMAALFTGNGYETVMLATSKERIPKAERNWRSVYDGLAKRGLVTEAHTKACEKLLRVTADYEDLADADVIYECAVEDLQVKFEIYEKIEAFCPGCCAIVSTSSAKSPETLRDGLKQMPQKLVVAHPFYPPHLVPFVELVKAEGTDENVVKLVYDLLEDCGRKVCVMKKSAPGFIANRLQHALLREATYMVEQGMADPEDIDKALMYSFMPRYTSVGLFEHQDAAGLDMVLSIEDYLLRDLSTASETPDYIRAKVAAGDLGHKTGEGIYKWNADSIADFHARAAEPYWKYFNWKLPK